MDIRQLEYLLAIVKAECNLTKAAEVLLVSQPALSKMVATVENDMDIQIFIRQRGRLVGLTPAGEILIGHAQDIVAAYNEMRKDLLKVSKQIIGRVRIGVPSMLLEVLFTSLLPSLILENPLIQFDIVESSATQLKKKFLDREIDLLVSLDTGEREFPFAVKDIITSEPYVAIMGIDHALVTTEYIEWAQLESVYLALPSSIYHTRRLIEDKLERENVSPPIRLSAASNNFLIKSTLDSNLVTIQPKIFYNFLADSNENLVCRHFRDPIYWDVNIWMDEKHSHTQDAVDFTYQYLRSSFQ